ncbi:MAG TPA: acetyltransferase [Dehalococcoidia bacterium]|nr:acetyltransferase [Dehalococcoidia bacterium]
MKKVVILGIGGTSTDILDTLSDVNAASGAPAYECAGFLDDDASRWGTERFGVPVLGPLDLARTLQDCTFINGIGSPTNFWMKEPVIGRTGVSLELFETLVHPTASVSRMARLGRGTVVFQNVTITANAELGDHVVVLPNSVISHDVVVGDYSCVAGGVCVSGEARIGRACYLGTNSSILGGVRIGDGTLVGMGSVVLRDIAANSVVIGNPARFLRSTRPTP